jgi:hypothetical protein
VRYKYVPVPGNRKGRSDTGYDQRIFVVDKSKNMSVISMKGNMSAQF